VFTLGGEALVPDLAAAGMLLLVTGHEKGHPWLQESVPRALADRSLAAIDNLDGLGVRNRDLSGS